MMPSVRERRPPVGTAGRRPAGGASLLPRMAPQGKDTAIRADGTGRRGTPTSGRHGWPQASGRRIAAPPHDAARQRHRHSRRWHRPPGNADLWPVLPVGAGTARRRRAESRIATHRDGSCLGAVPIPGGGVPVPGRASAQSALRRSPRSAGLCRPEVGVPLPARRSAWWHGRDAPVQRSRGAFCDSASASEVEKSGRTVSAIPMYGSRRTLGFPPRRNHLATGGPSRRPPSAGCADQRSAFPCLRVAPPGGLGAMRQFSVRVAPSATRRELPRLRNPDERCLPFQCTDHAERWDSRREGTTSQLGVLPAARLRRAVPAPTGRTGRRSAFPCLRVAPPGGLGAMRQFSVRVAPSATQQALPPPPAA